LLAMLMLHSRDDVFPGRHPDDTLRRVVRRTALRVELRDGVRDRADRRSAFSLYDDAIPRPRWDSSGILAEQIALSAPDGRQLHGDERGARRRAHSCSTSQSATSLTQALRSSAKSARSIAAKA